MRQAVVLSGLIALQVFGLAACGKYGPPVRRPPAPPAAAATPAAPPAAAATPTAPEPDPKTNPDPKNPDPKQQEPAP